MVLTGDALLVGDAGRPDLHAHGDQTVEEMAGTLYRSLTERLLALPDHLALYPGPLLGLRLRARPLGHPGLDDRLRAPQQRGAPVRLRGDLRRGADQGHPAGARAAGRDHRGQPERAPARRGSLEVSAGPPGAAREPRAVLAARRGQRPGRGDGRPRALDPAADRAGRIRRVIERRGALIHRRLRARQVVHQPRRGGVGRAGRETPPAAARLGGRASGPAPDRARAELGLDRRRERLPRDQPGARLVDDRGDEDRPRRAEAAGLRAGSERGRRIRRRRRGGPVERPARERVRAARRARGRSCRRGRRSACSSLSSSSATRPTTSPWSRLAITPTRIASRRRFDERFPTPPTASPRFVPVPRRGSSTTSTTPSPGA